MWPWKRYTSEMLDFVKAALRLWDPIGVLPDVEESPAFNEYDSYAPKITSMLFHGTTVEQIAKHLSHVRQSWMGLPENIASDLATAEDLLESWNTRFVSK